jgi:hypothetical protein
VAIPQSSEGLAGCSKMDQACDWSGVYIGVNVGLTGDQVVLKVNIMVAHFNPFH